MPRQKSGRTYAGHEPRKGERIGHALVLRYLADIVAIIEGRDALSYKSSIASTCFGDRGARRRGDSVGIALAHLLPVFDAPAGRQITVHRIMREV